MLDCWLESKRFCSWDKVSIPKLKAIHQWIKSSDDRGTPKGWDPSRGCWPWLNNAQQGIILHSTYIRHAPTSNILTIQTCLVSLYPSRLKNALSLSSHCHSSAYTSSLFLQSLDRLCFASMLWVLHVRPNGAMKARWAEELPNILGLFHK